MDLADYQAKAATTDQTPAGPDSVLVPLLGMAGEVGSLLVEYKKHLRDGPAHRLFREQFAEELGDMLWYLANLATKFDLSLDEIAAANLGKTQDRWPTGDQSAAWTSPTLFDESSPEDERLPRRFSAEIQPVAGSKKERVVLLVDDRQVGNELRDNSYVEDGYRFHDVFHLGHAAMLGWSPIVRGFLDRKRRSVPELDDVEDGGRASVVEEAVVAFVFEYARRHSFLDGVGAIDYSVLKTVKALTSQLEVSVRSAAEWERCILESYKAWHIIREAQGGILDVDLEERSLQVRK